MPDYAKLAATALRLINNAGRTMEIHKLDTTPADNARPWRSNEAPRATAEVVTVKGVFVHLDSLIDLGMHRKPDKGDTRRDTELIMVAAKGIAADLMTFDEVDDGGKRLKIERVQLLKTGDVPLIFAFEVKR